MKDTDDRLEELCAKLTPRRTEAELRGQILDAVGGELDAGETRRRWRRIGMAVVAAALSAVLLNVWMARRGDARLADFYGPAPTPATVREVVEAVESVTDVATARWFEQRLTAAWRSRRAARGPTTTDPLQAIHGTGTPKGGQDDEMDRRHHRDGDRDRSGCQRD